MGDTGEKNCSHVVCLLHYYGIPASEVMTVCGHISKTSGCVYGTHRRVEHRQRAERRLCVGSTPFGGMLGPLVICSQRLKTYDMRQYLDTLHRCQRNLSKACCEPKASSRTTSQSSLDAHEDRDLQRRLRLKNSFGSVPSITFET